MNDQVRARSTFHHRRSDANACSFLGPTRFSAHAIILQFFPDMACKNQGLSARLLTIIEGYAWQRWGGVIGLN